MQTFLATLLSEINETVERGGGWGEMVLQEVTDRLALCRRERLRERSGSHDNSWAESTRAERERQRS